MPFASKEKRKEYQKKYFQKYKDIYRLRQRTRRVEREKWFLGILDGRGCIVCDEKEKSCLDFHHINPKTKNSGISALLKNLRSKVQILKEIEKCIILCSNCHRKIHAKVIELPRLIPL